MPPNSRPRAEGGDIASLLQRFDALLEALRPALADPSVLTPDNGPPAAVSPTDADLRAESDVGQLRVDLD